MKNRSKQIAAVGSNFLAGLAGILLLACGQTPPASKFWTSCKEVMSASAVFDGGPFKITDAFPFLLNLVCWGNQS
jgi:hypothetical protein